MLEVVARMPYFAYISMLHLYESLGWWRAGAELRRVSHFPPRPLPPTPPPALFSPTTLCRLDWHISPICICVNLLDGGRLKRSQPYI